jgi:hypothetical protein
MTDLATRATTDMLLQALQREAELRVQVYSLQEQLADAQKPPAPPAPADVAQPEEPAP